MKHPVPYIVKLAKQVKILTDKKVRVIVLSLSVKQKTKWLKQN